MTSKRVDIDDFEVWWKYEQEGWTLQEIADLYGVSSHCIYDRLYPEKKRKNNDEFRLKNPDYDKEYNQSENGMYVRKTYQQSDNGKARTKRYQQSEKGKDAKKTAAKKNRYKRRSLGFICLNPWFPGGAWHHIDDMHVICMPEKLHQCIKHNVWTGEGMEAINEIAFQYIDEYTFDKLIAGEI